MPRQQRIQQSRPEIIADPEGAIKTVNDVRLPQNTTKYISKDIIGETWTTIWPITPSRQIRVVNGEAAPEKLIFNIRGEDDILIDWNSSYITFQIDLIKQNGTVFGSDDVEASSRIYCTLAEGAENVLSANDTIGFIYTRGVNNLFKKITVRDLKTMSLLDETDNFDLVKTIELSGQDAEFWDGDSERDWAHLVGSTVHTFQPEYNIDDSKGVMSSALELGGVVPTSTHVIPWSNRALPIAVDDWGGTYVFPEVRKMLNSIVGGYQFTMAPPSEYLMNGGLMSASVNPIVLEMIPNSYAAAFTDLYREVSDDGKTWDAASSICKGFVIKNVVFNIHKYYLSAEATGKQMGIAASVGWSRFFSAVRSQHASVAENSTRTTIQINDSNIHSLEKIAVIIRRQPDIAENSLISSYEFTNGTAHTQGAQAYNGITTYQATYMMNKIPTEPVQFAPYRFVDGKILAARLFGGNCLQKVQYEGLDPDTHEWINGYQTAFFVGYNFQNQEYASNGGLDLSKGSLAIDLTFGPTHPNLELDIFYWISSQVQTSPEGIALMN